MLRNVRVRNFALISRADIEFTPGLNVLTGETGAGKSILIDAVTAGLGGRMKKEVLREGEETLVELVFSPKGAALIDAAEELLEEDPGDELILTRRVKDGHSAFRANGAAVTAAQARRLAELLLDIHGQQENAALSRPARQLEILDRYGGEELLRLREKVGAAYHAWKKAEEDRERFQTDTRTRQREEDLLRYEIREITEAGLKEGEEEECAAAYRRLANSSRLTDLLTGALRDLSSSSQGSCLDTLGRVIRRIREAGELDGDLAGIGEEFAVAEDMLSAAGRNLEHYVSSLEYDEQELGRLGERLDQIRRLQGKYGENYPAVMDALAQRQARLDELGRFEEERARAEEACEEARRSLEELSGRLSEMRRKAAPELSEKISGALTDLGFVRHDFAIAFLPETEPGERGADAVEYRICTNPGSPLLPMSEIASGGELSRIMLAVRAVLAGRDETPSLIFDEIDAGISGRTAQKVSEKLVAIAEGRQVLCITHLPQIAAMADSHYLIEKEYGDDSTSTRIEKLSAEGMTGELARLLGGAQLTETVRKSALEMKALAEAKKEELRSGR